MRSAAHQASRPRPSLSVVSHVDHRASGIGDAPDDVSTRQETRTSAWCSEVVPTLSAAVRRDIAVSGGTVRELGGIANELVSLLEELQAGASGRDPQVTEAFLDDVRSLAGDGVGVEVASRAIRRIDVLAQDFVLSEAADRMEAGRAEAKEDASTLLLRLERYADNADRVVRAVHAEALRAHQRTWTARRAGAFERLVRGELTSEADEQLLGARLGVHHLVAAVVDDDRRPAAVTDPRIHDLVRRTTAVLGGCHVVSERLATETILWWSRAAPPSEFEMHELRKVKVPSGLAVGVSDLQFGGCGVARGHAEAVRAAEVAFRASDRRVAMHRDILLPATILSDRQGSRELVARELAGVLGRDQRSRELRRTVLLFLRSAGSRKAVAESLNVAPNTVAYRVERFELLRGRTLKASRLETWVALDLVDRMPSLLDDLTDGVQRYRGTTSPVS